MTSNDERVVADICKFLLKQCGRNRGYCGDSPGLQINLTTEQVRDKVKQIFNLDDIEEVEAKDVKTIEVEENDQDIHTT